MGKELILLFLMVLELYKSGSKVIYPDIFEERKREILVEGRFIVDVAKRKDCPICCQNKRV